MGGHGAALTEDNWDDIASFIVAPGIQPPSARPPVEKVKRVVFWGKRAPVVWAALLAIFLVLILWLCLEPLLGHRRFGSVIATLLLVDISGL